MNNSKIAIYFDTSVLSRIDPRYPPLELRLLLRLSRDRKITLLLPDMARREWTESLIDTQTDGLNKILKRIKDIASYASQHPTSGKYTRLHSAASQSDATQLSQHVAQAIDKLVYDLGFKIITHTANDYAQCFNWYFKGELPFSGRRHRNDIPDAVIYAALTRVANDYSSLIFVSNDKQHLRGAQRDNIDHCGSIGDVTNQQQVRECHPDPEYALWWEENYKMIRDRMRSIFSTSNDKHSAIADSLNSIIDDIDFKPWLPFEDYYMNSMYAESIESVSIDWQSATSKGDGLLAIECRISAETSFDLWVSRWDAFESPPWIDVSLGDFESETYFDANGYATIIIKSTLLAQVKQTPLDDMSDLLLEDIEFELTDYELLFFGPEN